MLLMHRAVQEYQASQKETTSFMVSVPYSDVTLTPQDGRWRYQLSATRNTEKNLSLIADSKFSAIYHRVASM